MTKQLRVLGLHADRYLTRMARRFEFTIVSSDPGSTVIEVDDDVKMPNWPPAPLIPVAVDEE